MEMFDCAIVGGGAAGLTGATYLGRFKRHVVVFDDGGSRLLDIPKSRNVPGFPGGIAGSDLHERMLEQALRYGMRQVRERVTAIERFEGRFKLHSVSGAWLADAVLLATGSDVTHPDLSDFSDAVARGIIRYCPICDGLECEGKRVGVLASKPASLEEAVFLRTFVEDVTLLPCGPSWDLSNEQCQRAGEFEITVADSRVGSLALSGDQMAVTFLDGSRSSFDVIYPCLGSKPRSELAVSLGAEVTPTGGLLVDSRQQTNVPMLYAAGDVLEGLDQIASGCGQASIAATAIHNQLRRR